MVYGSVSDAQGPIAPLANLRKYEVITAEREHRIGDRWHQFAANRHAPTAVAGIDRHYLGQCILTPNISRLPDLPWRPTVPAWNGWSNGCRNHEACQRVRLEGFENRSEEMFWQHEVIVQDPHKFARSCLQPQIPRRVDANVSSLSEKTYLESWKLFAYPLTHICVVDDDDFLGVLGLLLDIGEKRPEKPVLNYRHDNGQFEILLQTTPDRDCRRRDRA